MAAQDAQCLKVFIFCNHGEVITLCKLPNLIVSSPLQTAVSHMIRRWVQIRKHRGLVCATTADQRGASRRSDREHIAFTICRECKASQDVLTREIGKIVEDF